MFQKARTTPPKPTGDRSTEDRSPDSQATQARLLDELASVATPRELELEIERDLETDSASPPRFRPTHAGRYVITDPSGRAIGSAIGDYVVGFTVSCWERSWRFPDLDYAKIVVSLEAEARNRSRLRDAS